MIIADRNKKFVLRITVAFKKYAVFMAITNKNAETVANTIDKKWFSKFGILVQIGTKWGKRICEQIISRTIPSIEC
jgi:hypothetical protein